MYGGKLKGKEQQREIESLIMQLGDKGWMVRAKAAISLGRMGEPASVPAVISALNDENYLVRYHAADALRQIGTPEAMQIVKEWEKINQ